MFTRIYDLRQELNPNEYVLVEIIECSRVRHPFKGAVIRVVDECSDGCFLFSNEVAFDGACPMDGVQLQGFRYSWALNSNCLRYATNLLNLADDCCFSEVRLLSEDDVVAFQSHSPSSNVFGEFISPNYTQDEIYSGMSGYHSHVYSRLNRPKKAFRGHRIGVELEVEFNSTELKHQFTEVKSNWFYKERDGSLNDEGVEIITIPLLPKDAKSVEFWKPLTDALNERAISWDSGRCGLHIHIGREVLGSTEDERQLTIGKLLLVYHEFIKDTYFNKKIYGRERGYNDHEGKTPLSSAVKELGVRILQDNEVANKVQKSVIERSSYDRYFDINITPSRTIEFRKGRGSINPERIAIVVEYSEMLCKYAKQAVWQQLSYESFIHYLKASCKKGTSLYEYVWTYA